MDTINQWLENEGYPITMPMTRDNLANIIDRYISTLSTPTHGRTAEDIFAKYSDCYADTSWYSDDTIPPIRVEGEVVMAITEKQFLKAMHDFRNQLHQVREVSAEDISNAAVAYSLMHADVADRLKKYLVEVVFVDVAKWMQSHPVNTGDGCKEKLNALETLVEKFGHLEVSGEQTSEYERLYNIWKPNTFPPVQ